MASGCTPSVAARSRHRLHRDWSSEASCARPGPAAGCGGTLSSTLKRPSSVTISGQPRAARNSSLRGAGRPSASISHASSSSPTTGACADKAAVSCSVCKASVSSRSLRPKRSKSRCSKWSHPTSWPMRRIEARAWICALVVCQARPARGLPALQRSCSASAPQSSPRGSTSSRLGPASTVPAIQAATPCARATSAVRSASVAATYSAKPAPMFSVP